MRTAHFSSYRYTRFQPDFRNAPLPVRDPAPRSVPSLPAVVSSRRLGACRPTDRTTVTRHWLRHQCQCCSLPGGASKHPASNFARARPAPRSITVRPEPLRAHPGPWSVGSGGLRRAIAVDSATNDDLGQMMYICPGHEQSFAARRPPAVTAGGTTTLRDGRPAACSVPRRSGKGGHCDSDHRAKSVGIQPTALDLSHSRSIRIGVTVFKLSGPRARPDRPRDLNNRAASYSAMPRP